MTFKRNVSNCFFKFTSAKEVVLSDFYISIFFVFALQDFQGMSAHILTLCMEGLYYSQM